MITLEDIRIAATAFPEVTEQTHFKLPAFKVRDKVLVVLQAGDAHAIVHVDQGTAAEAVADLPDACEEVWRNDRIFVGVRVDLAEVPEERLHWLVERAWRHRAPKRTVAAYDAGS